jgi:hypothetical protein
MNRVVVIIFIVLCLTPQMGPSKSQNTLNLNFDQEKLGKLPRGWEVGATNPSGKIGQWSIQNEGESGKQAFAIHDLGKINDGRFNLSWNSRQKFKDLTIETMMKSFRGKIDQGGGLVWRFIDQDNYYVARFNPLEDNFRIYTVKEGTRKVIGSTRIKLASKSWHQLRVKHAGNHIEGFINGKKILDVIDASFVNEGYVGVWTKADAVTLFLTFEATSE